MDCSARTDCRIPLLRTLVQRQVPRATRPGRICHVMEMLVMTIHDDVVKASIGEKNYRKSSLLYLITVFFFHLYDEPPGLRQSSPVAPM